MATNFVYKDAESLSLPVPDGTVSGDPVIVGSLVGVAETDKGAGGNSVDNATVRMKGAANLAVGTTTALDVGDPVYIVKSSGALTTTDNTGANPIFGYALEPKGTTAGEVILVKIAQV